MQINIDLLDLHTVDKAIRQIEEYQKHVKSLIPEFLKRCAESVRDLANKKLESIGYEGELVSAIQNSWSIKDDDGIVMLINSHDKAVYIEFGTGIKGETNSHKQASQADYRYDVKNHGIKGWNFVYDPTVGLDVLGLEEENFTRLTKGKKAGMVIVHTIGTPASMFLYQAASDFVNYKLYKRIWNELARGKQWT